MRRNRNTSSCETTTTTSTTTVYIDRCSKESCEEVVSFDCVKNTINGECIGIKINDSLTETVETLFQKITGEPCDS